MTAGSPSRKTGLKQRIPKYDELVDVLADGLLALLVDNKDAP